MLTCLHFYFNSFLISINIFKKWKCVTKIQTINVLTIKNKSKINTHCWGTLLTLKILVIEALVKADYGIRIIYIISQIDL